MSGERAVEPDSGAQLHVRHLDRRIAELAERQHGVVARAQLFEIGLGRRAIGHRLERGRLHRIHRGVYAVGHRVLSAEGRWMSAVLSGGPGAVLSHRSAAALWGIRPSMRAGIEVTVPRPRRSRPGLEFHCIRLAPDEITVVGGVPLTTVPRTVLDLAAMLGRRHVERAMHEADVRRLTDSLSLGDLVARYPGRRGIATIKAILAAGLAGAAVTRSELEERFLIFLERTSLPPPRVNERICVRGRWIECDCVWAAQRLIVELDGHATHSTAAAYERDRDRDRILNAAGWRVVRITWRQLNDHPEALAADLGIMLR